MVGTNVISLRRMSPLAPPAAPSDPLWSALKSLKREGAVFQRHKPLGPFIVDYLCAEARLVVEIVTAPLTSAAERASELARTKMMEDRGYRVLRFWEDHVRSHPEGVVSLIRTALSQEVPEVPRRKILRRQTTRH